MWLADGSHTQSTPKNSQETEVPQKSGLMQSIGSRLLRAVPWSSPRRSVLPTHDEPTPPKRPRIEQVQHTPEHASYTPAKSTLPPPNYTPDRTALFARAATPSALRSRGQLTPARARVLPGGQGIPASASTGGLTPGKSSWSTLHLGPTQTPSLSTHPSLREFVPQKSSASPRLPVKTPRAPAKDAPLPASASHSSVLGKRDETAAEVEHEDTPSARKRRMVWDPEMGFVDADDLEARRPKPPPPQNEAERILRALESMRTPLGDARREGIVRSQSMPSWHTSSISVPLPTSDTNTSPASRSPARSIAPHSRSTQRIQQLRRTQVGQKPSMRSKLRNSVQASEMYDHVTPDEEEQVAHEVLGLDDDAMREEELEMPVEAPVRRSRRTKAKTKATQTETEPEAPKPAKAEAPAKTEAPVPPAQPEPKAEAPAKKDNFSVRADDEPDCKRSVLRQGSTKQSRRHAPSGRITAFDDDEEEDDMPQSEELEKIKLPTSLFPTNFSFETEKKEAKAAAPAPPAEMTPKDSGSLLGRLSAPQPSTTPAKAPATGSTLFGAKPAEDKPQDKGSSFFAAPPASTSSSLSTEKNDGPVPSFFGKPAAPSEPKGSLGLAGAFGKPAEDKPSSFSFGAPKPAEDKPVEAPKPSAFSFGNDKPADKPAEAPKPAGGFSFGSKPADDKPAPAVDKPAGGFSFSKPAEDKPSGFSFGAAKPAEDKPSGFSFGAPKPAEENKDKPASGFSFGAPKPAEENKDKRASGFSFGAPKPAEENQDKPASGFSFGAPKPADENKEKPTNGFSFGTPKPADENKDKPAGGFSFSEPAEAKPSGFSFGAKPAEQPALSFGAKSDEGKDKPAFAFNAKPTESEKPAASGFSFGSKPDAPAAPDASSTGPKPTFGFGGATDSAKDTEKSAPFSFASADKKPEESKPSAFGAADAKPGFSFGAPADKAPQFGEKRDRDEDEPASKRAAPGLSAAAAPFTLAKPAEKPAVSFGAKSDTPAFGAKPAESAPSFGFGAKPDTPTFGAKPTETPAFGTKPAETPAFGFGAKPAEAPAAKPADTPSFSFGAKPDGDKPAFAFGSAPGSAPGSSGSSPAPTTSFSFTNNEAKPSFAFGTSAEASPASGSPAPFAFNAGAPATGFGAPGGFSGPASPAPATTPTTSFSFTQNTPAAPNFTFGGGAPAAPGPPAAGPAAAGSPAPFAFGTGTPPPQPTTPSTFAFNAPSPAPPAFGFGNTSAPGSPAPPSFGTPPPGAGGGLFNMGAPPAAAPGGRQIKPLRQPRRR